MAATTWVSLFIFIYVMAMIGIGFWSKRRASSSVDEYLLAGRSLGRWMLPFTAAASSLSGFLFLGFAGFSYRLGFDARWQIWGIIFGAGCCAWIIGERIRSYTLETGALTVPDFLESRYYDSKKRYIRMVSSIVILVAVVVYTMAQIVAAAKVLEAVFGWDYLNGVLFGGVIVVFYTAMGGYVAVVWTEFFQGIIKVLGTIVCGFIGYFAAGGLPGILNGLEKAGEPHLINGDGMMWITCVGFVLGAGIFGYLSQPTLQVRFMAARDRKSLFHTVPTWIFIQSLLIIGIFWAAIGARALYPDPNMLPGGDTEKAVIYLLSQHAHPAFYALMVTAVLSAIMSTASSLLMLASSAVTEDIICKTINRKLDQKSMIKIGRITVVLIGILGMLLAIRPFEVIFWITEWAWGAFTAFGPVVLLGLYWKRTTREGALAGLIVGFLTAVAWSTPGLVGAYKVVHMSLVTFIFGMVATVIVSLFTKAPPQEIQDIVERAQRSDTVSETELTPISNHT